MDPLLAAVAEAVLRRPGRHRMDEDAFYRMHGRFAVDRAIRALPGVAAVAAAVVVVLSVA